MLPASDVDLEWPEANKQHRGNRTIAGVETKHSHEKIFSQVQQIILQMFTAFVLSKVATIKPIHSVDLSSMNFLFSPTIPAVNGCRCIVDAEETLPKIIIAGQAIWAF